MTNKWVEHIKAFAKAHNISYGCALSNPECLASYKAKKNTKETHTTKNITKDRFEKNKEMTKMLRETSKKVRREARSIVNGVYTKEELKQNKIDEIKRLEHNERTKHNPIYVPAYKKKSGVIL